MLAIVCVTSRDSTLAEHPAKGDEKAQEKKDPGKDAPVLRCYMQIYDL